MACISIIDYGVGNIYSVAQAIQNCGAEAKLITSHADIRWAEKIILPGVGAFGKAVDKIRRNGLNEALCQFAETGRPILGICLGMQLLFDRSNEYGEHWGLGLIPGHVAEIPSTDAAGNRLRRPHIGWADINIMESELFFIDPPKHQAAYFLHSYTAKTDSNNIIATVDFHGHSLAAAVASDNILGVQFHPEKSGGFGLNVIANFIKYS